MPSDALSRVVDKKIIFDTRPPQVTEVTRPYSSIGTEEDPVQPCMDPAGGNLMRPFMETARQNPLRDNKDQARCSCGQIPHTRLFLKHFDLVHTSHCGSRCRSVCLTKFTHAHVITCLSVRCLFLFCLLPQPLAPLSLSLSTCSLSCSSTSMSSEPPRVKTTALTHNEEYCPVAIHHPPTGYEPNVLDNFDYSETSAAIFQDESGDIDTELSYSCDAELDDEIIGKALSSPLFIQEREEPANRRQVYHSHEEGLLSAQSFFTHKYGETRVRTKFVSKRKSCRDMDNERIRILLERQKEQILAEVRTEIQKHEFQADSDGRSIQELTGFLDSQRREIDHTIASDEQLRRDQQLLQEQLSEQNRDLREAHIKSLHEMEELKRVQGLRVDESSRRRLIESQDTVNEFVARIQELQNEANCMNDSRDYKDAESVRSGLSHVPSQSALFPFYRDLGRLPSRIDKPPDIYLSRRIQSLDF